MNTRVDSVRNTGRGIARSKQTTFLVALTLFIAFFAYLTIFGAGEVSSLKITLALGLQGLGGWLIWRWFSQSSGVIESIGMGFAIGTVLSVFGALATQLLGLGLWGWLLPAVLGGAVKIRARLATNKAESVLRAPLDLRAILAAGAAFVLGLGSLVINLQNYPLTWSGLWSGYHPDMPFFEALGTSLARFGPFDSIFIPGGQIRYHWLVYAWSGQLSEITDAQSFVVLTRALPAVAILASSCLVIGWTARITKRLWTPTLAAVLLLSGGYLGAVYGGILNFDSPSQALGVVWLLAFSLIAIHVIRAPTILGYALAGVLMLALTGGKVSAALPVLAGVLLVAVVGIYRREKWARAAVTLGVVSLIAVVLAYFAFLAGANGGGGLVFGSWIDRVGSQQGFNPIEGMAGIVLGTLIIAIAIGARWAGMWWLFSQRESRWQIETIFGFGLALSSLLALLMFKGFNEIWFATASSAPLTVICVVGFERAINAALPAEGASSRRLVLLSMAGALLVFIIVWLLWATGPSGGSYWQTTSRWMAPFLGIIAAFVLGYLAVRFGSACRGVSAAVIGVTLVLTLAVTPGRLLGVGTGQMGVPPAMREDSFSFGRAPSVRGNDETLINSVDFQFFEAAEWLRQNSLEDSILATNLTFGPLIPAITQRQTTASGIQYQAPYGTAPLAKKLLNNDQVIWDFVNSPSPSSFAALCDQNVDWVWVYPPQSMKTDWAPYARTEFTNDVAFLLRVNTDACLGEN